MSLNNNNIYPPTLPTYGETYPLGTKYRLYFSISKYNSLANGGNVSREAQVVIYKQNSNVSAVNKDVAPCDILHLPIKDASDAEIEKYHLGERQYYIEIDPQQHLKDGKFLINTYYRTQIRFIASNAPSIPDYFNNDWLVNNEKYFSEWSTVCLIREISQIQDIILNGMNEHLDPLNINIWTSGEVEISGKIQFKQEEEKDTLRSYYIKFYDESNELVWDSGEIYNQSFDELGVNEFNYVVNKVFKDGERYFLKIGYTTRTLYSEEKTYPILMMDAGLERLNVTFSSFEDVENGRVVLNISNTSQDVFNGNLIIRRSCGDSDFTIWEDVAIISVENTVLNYTFYDYTIESGKWYRYGVQTRNNSGQRGLLTIYDTDLIVDFEDIFLNEGGKQLCIKYNPQISSFQKTLFENKVDTIGGKYPYIKRNGNAEYKQFPISGLITYFMDKHDYDIPWWSGSISSIQTEAKIEGIHNSTATNSLFESPESLYSGTLYKKYDDRNNKKRGNIKTENFSPWQEINETTYERDFRNKVMDFLYSNNVKLFRSATEGNILIKLMNVTFTPNQVLGRKVWTFNATAYEIDECSILNFDKYNIQKIGSAVAHFEYINDYNGSIEIEAKSNYDIVNGSEKNPGYLKSIYNKDVYHKDNYKTKIKHLDFVRIEFLDKPYLIDISGGSPSIIGKNAAYEKRENAVLGHIVEIDGKPIVVRNSNIYELKGAEIEINTITFPVDTKILLDYKLSLVQEPEETTIITSFYYINRISQLYGLFKCGDNLQNFIQAHFNLENEDSAGRFYQQLNAINGVRFEAEEGTVINLRESKEESAQQHVIGPTNSLDFWDPESVIMAFSFLGVRIIKATDYELQRKFLMYNRYIDMTQDPEADINNPVKNGIYIKNNKKQIWYKSAWYDCEPYGEDAYLIKCPVNAMIDYYCELVKGYYAK